MIGIEEYILMRKNEDKLKEFELNKRAYNTKLCVNYVLDYFNEYLIQHEQEVKKHVDNEKIDKYRSRVREYSPHVQNWLIDLYSKHYNMLHFLIRNVINTQLYFLLCYSEDDFMRITNLCLTKLTKKYTYLRNEKLGVLEFVKDYHRIESLSVLNDIIPDLPKKISNWIIDTQNNYNVNLKAFAYDYSNYMFNHMKEYNTPQFYKNYLGNYEIEKSYYESDNLFNIDLLYNDLYNIPFINNKKNELLALIIYYYTEDFANAKSLWLEYLEYSKLIDK